MKCKNCGGESLGPVCDYCGSEMKPRKKADKTTGKAETVPAPSKRKGMFLIVFSSLVIVVFLVILVPTIYMNWTDLETGLHDYITDGQGTPATQFIDETEAPSAHPPTAVSKTATTAAVLPGTRSKPIKKGQTAVFDGMNTYFDKYRLELTVADVKRGKEALDIVKKGNPFNQTPKSGKEYMLVRYKIKALDSEDDKKISLNNTLFQFVSKNGVAYQDFIAVAGLDPALTDIYKGGQAEGIVYGIVDEGDEPLIVFLERNNDGLWFSLK